MATGVAAHEFRQADDGLGVVDYGVTQRVRLDDGRCKLGHPSRRDDQAAFAKDIASVAVVAVIHVAGAGMRGH